VQLSDSSASSDCFGRAPSGVRDTAKTFMLSNSAPIPTSTDRLGPLAENREVGFVYEQPVALPTSSLAEHT